MNANAIQAYCTQNWVSYLKHSAQDDDDDDDVYKGNESEFPLSTQTCR